MTWEVEYTEEFEDWWESDLNEDEQDEIAAVVGSLTNYTTSIWINCWKNGQNDG